MGIEERQSLFSVSSPAKRMLVLSHRPIYLFSINMNNLFSFSFFISNQEGTFLGDKKLVR
jgi:hypothetical protein